MNEEDRKFEQRMREVTARIPFYSEEWTNREQSDPGITILENLTLLQMLLERQMQEVPEGAKKKCLELYGCRDGAGKSARVLLWPRYLKRELKLSAHQKFYTGRMCFETIREEVVTPARLKKVYTERDGRTAKITELEHGNPLSAEIFGKEPRKGDAVILLFDRFPSGGRRIMHLYVTADSLYPRNPSGEGRPTEFAEARWSCYTKEGFREVSYEDDTGVFLRSGEVKVYLGGEEEKLFHIEEEAGYALRCELLRADYDISPRVRQIDGPLLEVYEMDSQGMVYTIPAGKELNIPQVFQDEVYTSVYERAGDGYRPCRWQNTERERKAVCIRKTFMPHRNLGVLYGYDGQEFDIGRLGRFLPESMVLMTVGRNKETGEEEIAFFGQPDEEKGASCSMCHAGEKSPLVFRYDEEKGSIRILDVGDYTGCSLMLAACALYHGSGGNVRAANVFTRAGAAQKEEYENPASGCGGEDVKGFDKMHREFQEMLRITDTAVTKEDYESLVYKVPNLCIHKVHAYTGKKEHEVEIVVKPYGETPHPVLPEYYRRCITGWLEERRLLHTTFQIRSPVYIPVDVQAVIIVKIQYQNCRGVIEKKLKECLDCVEGNGNFGGRIEFVKVLKAVEHLDCVEYVQDFCLCGCREDIVLPEDALAYLGTMDLELKRNRIV